MLDRFFDLEARGTTAWTEVRAGLASFLTLAYILFVNPQILSATGMPADDVLVATALASAVATLIMGLWAKYPFALAPGMGLNAYFAFTVVLGMGIRWQVALAAVFVEGLLFLALSLGGVRTALLEAVPMTIRKATMAGIGLFLAMIGLQNAGLVIGHPETLLSLGPLTEPSTALAALGLVLTAALVQRRVPGALLIGIVGVAGVAWSAGLSPAPEAVFRWPSLPEETFLALDFAELASASMLTVILAFLFVDLLDTAGTLDGIGQLGGFVDEEGRLARSDRAFTADAVGTSVGALLGTSTVTTYIESATGVEEGGRTGLVAVTVAVLFVLSLFLAPIFVAVPAVATAPVLVIVGALMMRGAAQIEWREMGEALPAFLTIVLMPFTFSIANGLAFGILSWVGIRLLSGRWRDISWPLGLLALALAGFYGFLGPG